MTGPPVRACIFVQAVCVCIKMLTAIIHTIFSRQVLEGICLPLSLLIHLVPGIHVARPGTHVYSNFEG